MCLTCVVHTYRLAFICHQCVMLNCAIFKGSLVTCATCTSSFTLPVTLATYISRISYEPLYILISLAIFATRLLIVSTCYIECLSNLLHTPLIVLALSGFQSFSIPPFAPDSKVFKLLPSIHRLHTLKCLC